MDFDILDAGIIDFSAGLTLQKEIHLRVKSGLSKSVLILCSHKPVFTSGRKLNYDNIIIKQSVLKQLNIDILQSDRGGDITYHGPGQIIAYPIFNLKYVKKDIHLFLRSLEDTVIDLLKSFNIPGVKKPGFTGVWVGNNKICSIGIGIRNWITFHGLAFNVKHSDLKNFEFIKPCGLDVKMTSLESLLEKEVNMDIIKTKLITSFKDNFLLLREGLYDKGNFA
ncbi:MAG: lipoyl(octanoyl) transferase [Candidatus Omnitrophota bacterium]|jgi:lipoate-protein ligase B|nr:MAG: lipoyl(octanoyl) transferase [Candidatus Omnitrophota bacterium]